MDPVPVFYSLLIPNHDAIDGKVKLSKNGDVADLRVAVWKENSLILPGIIANQLTVYKNQAALDSKHLPLSISENIAGLGGANDFLVIKAPTLFRQASETRLLESIII